ncbi:MAG: cation:proton antiporter [Burkholderiaceae bacterium]
MTALELTLILLAAAVIAVVALRAFGVPPLVAYLAVGVLIGPHAAGLAGEEDATHGLGEIGVVFLMFSLGLEFSLPKLNSLRRHVFGLGAAQVGTTMAVSFLALTLMPLAWLTVLFPGGIDWRAAIAVSGAVAMSSTALVSKLLTERRELETDHGRRVFSVLLFQDLAVIPLLILIPALASGDKDWWMGLMLALFKAVCLLAILLRFGPPLMRRWFSLVARQRSHEVFTLNVLLATLLFAWLTKQFGLSMELGAFVAGMLIAETEFRYQVEEDIKPFRDVLLGLFFVTVGMQLDVSVLVQSWLQVLVLLLIPITAKFLLVLGLVKLLGGTAGTAIRTSLWLAQGGEFGFVLLSLSFSTGLLAESTMQPALAAMLLSLLLSPLLISQANRIALRASSQEWLQRSLQIQTIASKSIARSGHILIAGYGRSGQSLAHVLESEQVKYIALDLDPDRVREASAAGESVVYGDATRAEALTAAGVHRASAIAITFDDLQATYRLLDRLRVLAPQLPILVRSSTEVELPRLREAGATEVVPEVTEGSLILASHALALAGLSRVKVLRRMRTIREGRYELLQGFFRGADDSTGEAIESEQVVLHAIRLDPGSQSIGKALNELDWHGARVNAIMRRSGRIVEPPETLILEPHDTVVLVGTADQIGAAEALLHAG